MFRIYPRWLNTLMLLGLGVALTGCASLKFYGQAVHGHWQLMLARRPLAAVIADPTTPADIRAKLKIALRARAFASHELGLPDNASYTAYVQLPRPYVVWNVFAAPPLSLRLRESCFLLIGCLQYRGYFSEAAAERDAAARRADGDDVYVGGVAAYSTLGWFADPVVSSMLRWDEEELVKTLFHELAHQRLYVPNDTAFNESFASAVADVGYARWRSSREPSPKTAEGPTDDARFVALVLRHRERLATVYAGAASSAAKTAAKAEILAGLQAEFARTRHHYRDAASYGAWLARDLNNAKLASVNAYYVYVDAFIAILRHVEHDLPRFYRAAERLADAPKAVRESCLRAATADPLSPRCLEIMQFTGTDAAMRTGSSR